MLTLTRSPFGPRGPLIPRSPLSPFRPRTPSIPSMPSSPVGPGSPIEPVVPWNIHAAEIQWAIHCWGYHATVLENPPDSCGKSRKHGFGKKYWLQKWPLKWHAYCVRLTTQAHSSLINNSRTHQRSWKFRHVVLNNPKDSRGRCWSPVTFPAPEFHRHWLVPVYKLDGCIVWNAHSTVFGSKRSAICTQAVYFLHSTRHSVTWLNSRWWLVACD